VSFLLPLFVTAAHAESALEFRTTTPVAIVVDGQQASITSNMRQRLGGLDAGVHQLQVNGVFGKTLYEAEIDLPDNTLTTAEWVRGELRVVKTEWLDAQDEEAAADEVVGEAPEVVEVEAPVAPVAEEVPEVVAAPAVAPIAVPTEAPVAPAALVSAPPQLATAMPAAVRPRTLSVQATDGMRIDVVYQGRTLSVVVDGDTFRIEDPTGAVLALGSN
jgi:hypothetical protein